jgi:hypothetical protein
MYNSDTLERMVNILSLPHDVIINILSKLEFRDKVMAGLACKQWDDILVVGSVGGKHWIVDFNVDIIVSRAGFKTSEGLVSRQASATILRCATTIVTFC